MKSTCDEYAMKTVNMIANDLEYYISLVDKTVTGFERIDSNSESSTVGKVISNIAWYREVICERKC